MAFWRMLVGVAMLMGVARADIPNEDCLSCHSDPELTDEAGRSVFVDPAEFSRSAHEGWACVECHVSISELPHAEGGLPDVQCQVCHDEAQEIFDTSAHGKARLRGDADAPGCVDCHGTHGILRVDDPESAVHHRNMAFTCARCHANPKLVQTHAFSVNAPVDAYWQSTHFRLFSDDEKADLAPNCADCHGSHDLKASSDPESSIYWRNIPQMCGKCHADIRDTYATSIHGQAAARGVRQSPVCTDCHGEHEIRGPKDPKSTVYPAHVSETTCVWCHESVRVTRKFGLAEGRMQTYLDSYHGLANQAGSTVVANCASCHGVHDILPSSDAMSSIHPDRLPETCGKCHPGVGALVALGPVHINPASQDNLILYYVRQFYIYLIIATIGGMLVHNGLDLARHFRVRERLPDGDEVLRFTVAERLQHAVMALSFMVLAYSGFALQYPFEWWAAPFTWLGEGEVSRRLVHRIAAVCMVGACVFHSGYLVFTARGRRQLAAMAPKLKDVRDFRQMMHYYLGWTPDQPAFARFSYIEKLEYWALVWGCVVMTATGFSLWFANISLQFVPKWALDVAALIHYYEAWLAVLAIIVWHFYWVIFNPRVYPMSLVWLTGRMSRKAMAHEHPEELAQIDAEKSNDKAK